MPVTRRRRLRDVEIQRVTERVPEVEVLVQIGAFPGHLRRRSFRLSGMNALPDLRLDVAAPDAIVDLLGLVFRTLAEHPPPLRPVEEPEEAPADVPVERRRRFTLRKGRHRRLYDLRLHLRLRLLEEAHDPGKEAHGTPVRSY